MSQTTINPDASLVTLINVFTVAPDDQERLITLWQEATDGIIRHLPGFISANIHASTDVSQPKPPPSPAPAAQPTQPAQDTAL
jgi:hypothetical protein